MPVSMRVKAHYDAVISRNNGQFFGHDIRLFLLRLVSGYLPGHAQTEQIR